ncbi:MAG: aldehyde ferredoxin oxidoreductase family protein [Desulfobacterales bacterium]
MPNGFTGSYCIVDLTTGTSEVVEPGEDFYKTFLGGYGLGAAVISERQRPGIDPLSAESHLGFCSGLLTGTGAFFAGRFMVVGKSPLTGGWGDANAGGYFSRELKRAGYDAIFFTGAAESPVWVSVIEGKIEIRDAASLWGKDIPETERWIKAELGDQKTQVASIGVSGEKRSLISGIATDGARIAARSGLGAVMGSKNLKAVALRGGKSVSVARPADVDAIGKRFIESYKTSSLADRMTLKHMGLLGKIIARTGIPAPAQPSLLREVFRTYGTSGLTAFSAMVGDMPIKNWTGVGYRDFTFESAKQGSDDNVRRYQKRRYACQACPLGCGGVIGIEKGRFKGTRGHKPEYETIGAFGGLLLQGDFDAIVELNEMCNRAGIDTISTGGVIAFAIECFENGIIDERRTGGIRLGWGRTEEIIRLAERIIAREGFGDLLADGVKRASERIGNGSEKFAIHAGGQELPMHDSRFDAGFAIAYECEPTPGRHTISSYLYAGLFGVKNRFPAARRLIEGAKGKFGKEAARYCAGSFYVQLVNCSGMCLFGAITSSLPIVEYLNAATGWDCSPDEFLRTGERVLHLRKAFNMREGVTPSDHRLSERAQGVPALTSGPLKGVSVKMESLREAFYDTVGWDLKTGGPTQAKMRDLRIDHLIPTPQTDG